MQEHPSILSVLARLSTLILLSAFPVLPQTQNRIIEWEKSSRGSNSETHKLWLKQIDTIEIEDVSVDGKSITIGEAFTADVDWVKRVSFRVRNISPQLVNSIQIHVRLGEARPPRPRPYLIFCYGCSETEKGVMPGEEVTLKPLLGKFYAWARDTLAMQGSDISTVSKASIGDMQVFMPDGTLLMSECIKTANQKNACPDLSP